MKRYTGVITLVVSAHADDLDTAEIALRRSFVKGDKNWTNVSSQCVRTEVDHAQLVTCHLADTSEAGVRDECVICHLSAPRHGGLCCDHRYDEQPPCPACRPTDSAVWEVD